MGKKVYMDTGLLISGRSSPGIFNYLPIAVKCIIWKVHEARYLCYLLDDFLLVESRRGSD